MSGCLELFRRLFYFFHTYRAGLRGWPVLVLLWKGQQAVFPAIIWQGRDPESWCKASGSFCYYSAVWIRHCCKGDVWLPDTSCLQIVSTMQMLLLTNSAFITSRSRVYWHWITYCTIHYQIQVPSNYRRMVGPALSEFLILCPAHLAIHIICSVTPTRCTQAWLGKPIENFTSFINVSNCFDHKPWNHWKSGNDMQS